MRNEFINPFLTAVHNVLSTMCQTTPEAASPVHKTSPGTWGEVTGMIGMTSPHYSGNLVLSFDKGSALAIVSKMLFDNFTELNAEIVDAVGELTNMITGGAKQQLSELGHVFNMATPIMITGQGTAITHLSKAPITQILFTIPEGQFVLEVDLTEVSRI